MLAMPFSDIHKAVLLIVLGLGYIVCYLAKKEDKFLKTLGYLIGTFLMALSALVILASMVLDARFYRKTQGSVMMMPRRQILPPALPPKK
jgi:uncharacterized membrane protein affecting hemolysin expression